jgi:FAD/FMN-containing dehydrogenase
MVLSGAPVRFNPPPGIECLVDPAKCAAFASDADTQNGHSPRAVLMPRGIEDVVTLVQWANKTDTGIVPVSSSGRRRRGDTVPQRPNSVIADLSGLNKLIHADARDKIAIIEPGVNFGTLDRLLAPHGLRCMPPLMPRAGKSVIASYLEREPVLAVNEHWDTSDPFGGTNLVLGNGRIAPTGGAAIEGTLPEQLARGHRQMLQTGPTFIDLLRVVQGAQGSLGIMTWAAIYCERMPSQESAWYCSADALEPVVNLARDLLHRRLGNTMFIVDRVQLAMLLCTDRAGFQDLATRLPAWTLFVSAAGYRQQATERMAWQRSDVHQCAALHGAQVAESLEGHSAAQLAQRLRKPEPGSFRDRPLGAHRELFFMNQLDRVDVFVKLVKESLSAAGQDDAPLGVYVQPMTQGVNCHIEFTQAFDPSSASASEQAKTWHVAAQRCADAGGFFSRPYGRWSEFAFSRDAGTLSLMTMSQTILDPRGVMNPGRLPYGRA